MRWSSRKKKRCIFYNVRFILSEGNFFSICVLSQCIVYWKYFQNIYTFTYQKTLLHTLLLLEFKIVESLHFIFVDTYLFVSDPTFNSAWIWFSLNVRRFNHHYPSVICLNSFLELSTSIKCLVILIIAKVFLAYFHSQLLASSSLNKRVRTKE